MRSGRAASIAIALVTMATAPRAGAADPAEPPRKTVSELVVTANKTVSELVVTAAKCPTVHGLNLDLPRKPAVVSTFPSEGQMVRPGIVVMRVTFDRPVACAGGFSNNPPLPNPCPDRVQRMVLSYDRRTVRTVCVVDPDTQYAVRLNRDPGDAFRTVDGATGEPFDLKFSTSLEAPITDVCSAIREDVAMLAEVEKTEALDCTPRDDPDLTMVKAEVVRRDAEVRAARDKAIAEAQTLADAQQAKAAARDLEKAETLALSAYRKARAREWERLRAQTREAEPAAPNADEAPLVSGLPGLAPSNRTQSAFTPRPGAADLWRAPAPGRKPRDPDRPELAGWRQSFVVNGAAFDCGFEDSAVVCRRQ
jgi:hypothetical protein